MDGFIFNIYIYIHYIYIYIYIYELYIYNSAYTYVELLCLVAQLTLDCSLPGSSVDKDSPGKNTGVGCHALLQKVLPTQLSNPGFPHSRRILLPSEPLEKPKNTGVRNLSLLQQSFLAQESNQGSVDSLPPELPVVTNKCNFPGGSLLESACNSGDLGSIPRLKRCPGEGNDTLLQYSCLENSMDRGAWQATVHRVAKSRQN